MSGTSASFNPESRKSTNGDAETLGAMRRGLGEFAKLLEVANGCSETVSEAEQVGPFCTAAWSRCAGPSGQRVTLPTIAEEMSCLHERRDRRPTSKRCASTSFLALPSAFLVIP